MTSRPSTSLTIRHQIVIYRPPEEVFAYLADDGRAREWFAAVRLMAKQVPAEPAMTVYEPGRCLAFRDVAAGLPTYIDLRFTAVPEGARLDYVLSVELVGAWRWFAPYFRLTGPRLAIQALRELRDGIESAPVLVPL